MNSDRVWLRHPETGGYFHAPVDAVPDWRELGWEPFDPPPPEPNPVVVERIAWEREQAADGRTEQDQKSTTKRRSAAEAKGSTDG